MYKEHKIEENAGVLTICESLLFYNHVIKILLLILVEITALERFMTKCHVISDRQFQNNFVP